MGKTLIRLKRALGFTRATVTAGMAVLLALCASAVIASPAQAGQVCAPPPRDDLYLIRDCSIDTYAADGRNSGLAHVTIYWSANQPGGNRSVNIEADSCIKDTLTNGWGVKLILEAHLRGTPIDNDLSHYRELANINSPADGSSGCQSSVKNSYAPGFDFVYVNYGDHRDGGPNYVYVGTSTVFF